MNFRDKIKNLKSEPDQSAWSEMSVLLDENKGVIRQKPNRIMRLVLLVFALILIMGILTWLTSKKLVNNSQSENIITNQSSIEKSSNSQITSQELLDIKNESITKQNTEQDYESLDSSTTEILGSASEFRPEYREDILRKDELTYSEEYQMGGETVVKNEAISRYDKNNVARESKLVDKELEVKDSQDNSPAQQQLAKYIADKGLLSLSLLPQNDIKPFDIDLMISSTLPRFANSSQRNPAYPELNIMEVQFSMGGSDGVSPIQDYRFGYRRILNSFWMAGLQYGLVRNRKQAADLNLISSEQVESFIATYSNMISEANENTRIEYTDMNTISLQLYRRLWRTEKIIIWGSLGGRYSQIEKQRVTSIRFSQGLVTEIDIEQEKANRLDLELSVELDYALAESLSLFIGIKTVPGLAYYTYGIGSKVYF